MKRFIHAGDADNLPLISARKRPIVIRCCQINEYFEVLTREGTMSGKSGDYLMVGVHNELYICGKEIFEKSYDKVN